MKWCAFLILILFLFVGCNTNNESISLCEGIVSCPASSETWQFEFSQTLSPPYTINCADCRDLEGIQNAINKWNETLGQTIYLYSDEEPLPFIEIKILQNYEQLVEKFPPTLEGSPAAVLTKEENNFNLWLLESTLQQDNILAHELGHALGLGHSSCKLSLMYPLADSCQIITEESINLIKSHLHI